MDCAVHLVCGRASAAHGPHEDERHSCDDQQWSDVRQPHEVVTDGRPCRDCETPHDREESAAYPDVGVHAAIVEIAVSRVYVTKVLESPQGLQTLTVGEHAGSRRRMPLVSPTAASRFRGEEPENTRVQEMICPKTPC